MKLRNIFWFRPKYLLLIRVAMLLTVILLSAGRVAYSAQTDLSDAPRFAPKVQYVIDKEFWDPPSDIADAVRQTPASNLPSELVRILFQRGGFQNIMVFRRSAAAGPEYVVVADKLPKVGEVTFKGLTPTQMQQIRPALKTRVGLPYISEEAERDRESIFRKVFERGYRSAKVGVAEVAVGLDKDLKVTFPVSLQTPCRIAEVKTEPFEGLFDYFTIPIQVSSLCDRSAIEEILERQRSRLLSEGYFASELSLISMDVADDQERASVRLRYIRGPRTRLEVVNRQTGVISEVLSEFREKISAYDVLSLSDEELRSEVRRIFVNRGFASSIITGPTRLTDPNGDSVVRFFVQTGPLVVVGDVKFIGELPIPRQSVLDKLELTPGLFQGAVPFVEESLGKYKERLVNVYLDEGFSEVRVADPVASFSDDGRTVQIVFDVKPGLRSVLRDVTILGRPFDFSLAGNFQERILQPGQPVNSQRIKSLEDEVRIELMNAGYAYAQIAVTTKSLPPSGEIRPIQITVDLNAGPLVRIGKIYASGDVFGKQDRILLESGLREGDLFTPAVLETARTRVLRHDLFDSVLIEPVSSDAVDRKDSVLDIVVRLTAKESYTLGLSPGYGTRSGYRFNVDYAKNNLSKDGLRFTASTELSQEKLQNSALTNQRILGWKVALGLLEPLLRIGDYVSPLDWSLLSGTEVSAQSLTDRYFETLETGVTWRPVLSRGMLTLHTRFLHEWSKAIGQDVKPLEALERPTVKIRELVIGGSVDTRDSIEWPTRGLFIDVAANYARFGFYSDVRYDRFSADSSLFFPLYGRLSGALNLGVLKVSDVVNPRAESVTAPSSRRATLAGRALVRGFPEASSAITPGPLLWLNFAPPAANPSLVCQPTLKPVGATNVLYAKSEARFRTRWLSDGLGFAAFVDSGAAFFTASEQAILKARLRGGPDGLDAGSEDQCALKSAQVVGDAPVDSLTVDFAKKYYLNSYISTGLGLRYIIPNFASINVDVGFPLREPGDSDKNAACLIPSDVGSTAEAPACVKRRSTSKFFGLFPLPGAYHLGIGANF
ncbi:MAG: outer membrane protein assembly factor [Proteobacteria bacterium]|nr:outer membrane protein assembly factor [Pseudomonadota bacterium]